VASWSGEQGAEAVELQDYLAVVRKRWVSILLVTVLAVSAAAAATALTTPVYESRSQVFVSVRNGATTSDLLQGSNFTTRQVKSYTQLVTSPRVLIPVIEQLMLPLGPDQLASKLRADSPLDSVLINITASDEDPQLASDIANATANSLADEVSALEEPEDGPSPVQISTVRVATPPVDAASPNARLNLALGALVGLAAGLGLALLREVLDTRVRTAADIAQVTDSSVIAQIGYDDDAPQHPLIVQTNPQSHRSEAFRRLRTNLQFLDITDRPQTIVVTSSLPGEGKSTTSINLAITLADAGSRVALVDADLRRPSVAEYMGLEGRVGLTTVLIGRAAVEDVVQPWGNGYLHVLPSGQVPPNPSELLGSRAMASLLDQLSRQYDVVLIDTPPLLPVTDAAILARLTAGALVVVGADKIHRHQLQESVGSLQTVGARVLGIVLNRLERKQGEAYTYYDYSSAVDDATKGRKRKNRPRTAASGRDASPTPGHSKRPTRTPVARRGSRMNDTDRETSLDSLLGEPSEPSRTGSRWPGGPLA
jgi:capsular exopolysaccharide synthesis family protein